MSSFLQDIKTLKLYCSSHEDIIQRVGTYLVLTMVEIKLVQTTDKNKINYANKTVLNIIPLICNMPLKMIAATLKILNMMRKIKEN